MENHDDRTGRRCEDYGFVTLLGTVEAFFSSGSDGAHAAAVGRNRRMLPDIQSQGRFRRRPTTLSNLPEETPTRRDRWTSVM